jgi:peptidoglycan/xylan/chitin deacetylase (PgdA/CDA1 family)
MKKIVLLILLSASGLFAEASVYVLCYHSFLGRAGVDSDNSISNLSVQVGKMEDLGYKFVSFNDILSNRVKGNLNILVTDDDGNSSLTNAFKSVFYKHNIKPVLFIYPAIISQMYYAATFDELRQFQSKGAVIGGHGYNHLYVNKKLLDTDPQSFNREVYYSRKVLVKRMGVPVDTFAHPFGVFDETSKDELRRSGYKWGFTIRYGILRVPLELNKDPMELPRYMVTRTSWTWVYGILKKAAEAQK